MHRLRATSVAAVLAASVVVLGPTDATAAIDPVVLLVTTRQDVVDPDDAVLSLREAVDEAATNPEGTIVRLVARGPYRLGACGTEDDDANAVGDLDHTGTGPLTIDGIRGVTLRPGCPTNAVLEIHEDTPLTLRRLAVTGVDVPAEQFLDAPVTAQGDVKLDRVRFHDNHVWAGWAAGVWSFGDLTVTDSVAENSSTTVIGQGVVAAQGRVDVDSSIIRSNTAGYGGAGRSGGVSGGDVAVRASVLVGNSMGLPDEFGGAAAATPGSLVVEGSMVSGNTVEESGGAGGALAAGVDLTVRDSVLTDNTAEYEEDGGSQGGAAAAGGTLTVQRSRFEGNRAGAGGALSGADMVVVASRFTGNDAEFGGALSGDATVTDSVFSENTAIAGGAATGNITVRRSAFVDNEAWEGGALDSSEADIADSTFAGNRADAGGALGLWGDSAVVRSTFSDNESPVGSAVVVMHAEVTFAHSVLAGPAGSPHCVVYGYGSDGTFTSGGGNVTDDDSCGFGEASDAVLADVGLDPLAEDETGAVVVPPTPDGPLVDRVPLADCPVDATDQRSVPRPQGEGCEPGAVEHVDGALVPGAPVDLAAVSAPRQVELTWAAPADAGFGPVTGFTVRRDGEVVATVGDTATGYLDEDLQNGRTYEYEVTADNAWGSSATAGPVEATPVGGPGPANTFPDIPDTHWARAGVDWVSEHGIVLGFPDGTFRPDDVVTRAQAAQWLWTTMGASADGRRAFADVGDGHWAADGIGWAGFEGIATGYPDGAFRPRSPVTRAQWLAMLWRVAGSPVAAGSAPFSDTPTWVAEAAAWAGEHALVTGFADGTLRPDESLTRAQAAMSLHRLLSAPEAWSGGVAPPDTRTF